MIDKTRKEFERTNGCDHRRHPPKGTHYIDPMAQADWESFQKGWLQSREALAIELPEPYAVVGDYVACGGGRSVWDAEYAEKIDDRMCAKTPVYDLASLEAAGLKVKP